MMRRNLFDYDDGDYIHTISDTMAEDSDGNLLMRMGDHIDRKSTRLNSSHWS